MQLSRFAPGERVRLKQPFNNVVLHSCELMDWDPALTCMVTEVDEETHRVTVVSEEDMKMLEFKFTIGMELPDDFDEMELPEECFEHAANSGRILN